MKVAYEQIKRDKAFKELYEEYTSDGWYTVSVEFWDGQDFHFEGVPSDEFMKEKEAVMLALRGTRISVG